MELLQELQQAESTVKLRQALDLAMSRIRAELRANNFDTVETLLTSFKPDDHSIELSLTILTATLVYATNLPEREAFYLRVRSMLALREKLTPGMLDGLEGENVSDIHS